MASYGFLVTVDGSGTYNRGTVTRGATALSGGTAISLNAQDDDAKNSLHEALPVLLRSWANRASTAGVQPNTNFAGLLVDNGDGTYTVSSTKYDITSVTAGTAVTLPPELRTSGLTLQEAFARVARAAKNDKSANG